MTDHFDELASAVRNGFVHSADCIRFATDGDGGACDCHVSGATQALAALTTAARSGAPAPSPVSSVPATASVTADDVLAKALGRMDDLSVDLNEHDSGVWGDVQRGIIEARRLLSGAATDVDDEWDALRGDSDRFAASRPSSPGGPTDADEGVAGANPTRNPSDAALPDLATMRAILGEVVQSVWDHLGTERCREIIEALYPTPPAASRRQAGPTTEGRDA